MPHYSRYPADVSPADSVETGQGDSRLPNRTDYLLRTRRQGASSGTARQSPRHRALLERALAASDTKAPGFSPQASVTRWRVPTGALVILALVLGLLALWPVLFPGSGSSSSLSVIPVAPAEPSAGAGQEDEAGRPEAGQAGEAEQASTPGQEGQTDSLLAGAETTDSDTASLLVVHVAGAVQNPGVYELASGSRVKDGVAAAGGLRADADASAVNLAAPASDGSQIYIPVPGEVPPSLVGPFELAAGPAGSAQSKDQGAGSTGLVNINVASAEELQTLPKVGPVLAASIISWREQYGGFSSVDELDQVSGIGPATLEALRPLVTV